MNTELLIVYLKSSLHKVYSQVDGLYNKFSESIPMNPWMKLVILLNLVRKSTKLDKNILCILS